MYNTVHSDDLLKMGRYSILLCIFVEVAMLSQLSNTMLMVYAGIAPKNFFLKANELFPGAAPTIKSCGNMTFSSNEEACLHYSYCKEQKEMTFERQFYGITEQVRLKTKLPELKNLSI